MKLQEHLDSTDLDMTEAQVKAFFLGTMCAEKPMNFKQAFEELLSEDPNAREEMEIPAQELWNHLEKNFKQELGNMFLKEEDIHTFIELAKEQLDYFLTGMSLAGTNTESCQNQDLAELIDELEDTVEDMDDFLADSAADEEDGEDFKEFLLGTWADFTASK